MGIYKNRTDLRNLTTAAQIAGSVCDALIAAAEPGVSSMTLEAMANRLLLEKRSAAPFKNFDGFGHAICISLNAEIVNGPPSPERILQPGDLVSIAVGSLFQGFHGKAARTRYLGESPDESIDRLLTGTKGAIDAVAERSLETDNLKDVLEMIPATATRYGLTLIQGDGGAGIGKKHLETPYAPNNPGELGGAITLVPGMAFTLMPMMTLGASGSWHILENGWTQITDDESLSAHFADTCLMTEDGLKIISRISG